MVGCRVQVMVKVPAVENLIVFESPGLNIMPLALANADGAPIAAANWPFLPVTRIWVPPLLDGSSKVTDCPALMLTEVPEAKLKLPIVTVAAPPPVLAAGVLVGAGAGGVGAVVSVGAGPAFAAEVLDPPQAASESAKSISNASENLRIEKSPWSVVIGTGSDQRRPLA